MTYDDLTQWLQLPIHRLKIRWIESSTDVEFIHAEADSSYSIVPIVRTDMYGVDRVLGYRVEVKFITPQSNIVSIVPTLESMREGSFRALLELQAIDGQPNGSQAMIDLQDNVSVIYDISKGESRPRVTITVKSILATTSSIIYTTPPW